MRGLTTRKITRYYYARDLATSTRNAPVSRDTVTAIVSRSSIMPYIRKTKDEYNIEQYTGPQYGWERVHTVETWKEARQSRKEYRDNQPEYPVRIVKHRVRIADEQ